MAPGATRSKLPSPSRNPNVATHAGASNKSVPAYLQKNDVPNQTDQRIKKQRLQFENLLKQYRQDMKVKESRKMKDQRRLEKVAMRDEKI
jgi:anti-sigma regulatory factor (Ser/Thr protein kinase)